MALVKIKAVVSTSGINELRKELRQARKAAHLVAAEIAKDLMLEPTEFWQVLPNIKVRASKRRGEASTTTDNYVKVSQGFEHRTAFNKEFRPKTKPGTLQGFRGAGRAFPDRRREPVSTKARNFDELVKERLEGEDRDILTRAIDRVYKRVLS